MFLPRAREKTSSLHDTFSCRLKTFSCRLLHLNCLAFKKEEYRKMNTIRSYKHHLYTEEVNKKALGAFDDKRLIIENGIYSFPLIYMKWKNKIGVGGGVGGGWLTGYRHLVFYWYT